MKCNFEKCFVQFRNSMEIILRKIQVKDAKEMKCKEDRNSRERRPK